MAKAKSYKLQGREWTVKDLAEELGLSTPRVHGLLKEHNEDIKAIFASRGITPKPADKGPKARLFDYKGKQWTVKQLAEEFGLSNVRVNRLIKEHDGDIEKIALSREKSKKTSETKKTPKTEKTDEKTDIAVDDKESKSLELDLEDKVSFEGIEIDQSITDLYIRNPLNLTDIRALASLNNLQKLSLSDCYELTDISALASLNNLKELDLSNCKKLTDISAIDILKSLTNTEILIDKESKKAYEENLANLVDKKREELEIKLHLDDEVFVVKEKSSEELLDTMKNYIKKIHQEDKNLGAAEGFLIFNDLNEENHLLGIELINEDSAEFNYTFDIYSVDFHKLINDIIGEVGDYLLAANNAVVANDDSAMLKIFDRILGHKKIISIKNEVILGIRHPNFNNIEEEEYTEIAIDYDDPLNSILDSQNWDSLSNLRPDAVMSSLQFGFKDSVENTVTCYDFDLEEEELDHFDKDVFSSLISSKDINPTLLGVEHSCGSTITEIAKSKFIFEWEE